MTKIVEKPSTPISKLANIGLYYIRAVDSLWQGIDHVLARAEEQGRVFPDRRLPVDDRARQAHPHRRGGRLVRLRQARHPARDQRDPAPEGRGAAARLPRGHHSRSGLHRGRRHHRAERDRPQRLARAGHRGRRQPARQHHRRPRRDAHARAARRRDARQRRRRRGTHGTRLAGRPLRGGRAAPSRALERLSTEPDAVRRRALPVLPGPQVPLRSGRRQRRRPGGARRRGWAGSTPATVREHVAALRSVAGAVEELEVEDLQEEIDRTALLGEIRSTIFRLEHERPHERNPIFWVNHLFQGLYAVLARSDGAAGGRAPAALERLRAVPGVSRRRRGPRSTSRPRCSSTPRSRMLGGGGELSCSSPAALGAEAPELQDELRTAAARPRSRRSSASARRCATRSSPAPIPTPSPSARSSSPAGCTSSTRWCRARPSCWRYGLHLQEETTAAARGAGRGARRPALARAGGRAPERRARHRRAARGLPRRSWTAPARFVAERDLVAIPSAPIEVVPTPSFLASLVPFAAYEPPPIYLGAPARPVLRHPARPVAAARGGRPAAPRPLPPRHPGHGGARGVSRAPPAAGHRAGPALRGPPPPLDADHGGRLGALLRAAHGRGGLLPDARAARCSSW